MHSLGNVGQILRVSSHHRLVIYTKHSCDIHLTANAVQMGTKFSRNVYLLMPGVASSMGIITESSMVVALATVNAKGSFYPKVIGTSALVLSANEIKNSIEAAVGMNGLICSEL